MEVTASCQHEPVAEPRLELAAKRANPPETESILGVRMWGGDHVSNSVRDSVLRHLQRKLDIVRTVINARQNVAVDVDHGLGEQPPVFSLGFSPMDKQNVNESAHSRHAALLPYRANLLY